MKIRDLVNRLTYRSEWSDEDQAYIAHALELPSILAHADTPEGAISEVKIPIMVALEDMIEHKQELPKPLGLREYKGRVLLRTTPEKHKELAVRAAEADVSINQYILSKLG